jgi:hypothetical protein
MFRNLNRIQALANVKRTFNKLSTFSQRVVEDVSPPKTQVAIGSYLAKRLADAGLNHYFAVPGDFTLALLDEFIKEERLSMIGCCNELNAGYAADGYSRATGGLSAVCVTYM